MSLLSSILRGSLGFAVVSVAAFSVWAFGDLWFYHHGGEVTMYSACFLVLVMLPGVLLHRLLAGPRSLGRFYTIFIPAFLAYAVAWSAGWFRIGAGIGEWVASLAGSFAFAAVLAIMSRNGRALLPSTLVLFVAHSAGYFLGEWICYVSLHDVLSELIWGLLYGLGFGAGIGHAFWAMQRRK